MPYVQSKAFRSTTADASPASVNALVDTVWTDANAFLYTLPMNDVCDVRSEFTNAAGAYGTVTLIHYQVIVHYLVH